ncbi:MAG: hypothetical protein Q7J73_08395 [Dehalococcoidales bacterium]|nr:hypothetical protein [Dehalococcoidales bacterium]
MKNMKKMSLGLNLAKLVRLQQTNQARIAPIYDASLYIFLFFSADAQPPTPSPQSPAVRRLFCEIKR